jgi:hypothetical protein
MNWKDEEAWGYVREALFQCLGNIFKFSSRHPGNIFKFSSRHPWKFNLKLIPCGQCSGYGRQRMVSTNHAEYYLRLQGYGAAEYNCLVCHDFGELWRVKDGRVFRMGTLPLRVPGKGA